MERSNSTREHDWDFWGTHIILFAARVECQYFCSNYGTLDFLGFIKVHCFGEVPRCRDTIVHMVLKKLFHVCINVIAVPTLFGHGGIAVQS